MNLDFETSKKVSDFVSVPAGTYLCRVGQVRPGTTRNGDERWSISLVIAEGRFAGKQAAWDNLVFSPRGLARVRLVFEAFGLPSSGKVDVEPSDLEGCTALVEVRPAEYAAAGGPVIRRNEVPYAGYRSVAGAEPARLASQQPHDPEENGDPVPF